MLLRDEFVFTLQDADYAVSLPGTAVFLGGIKDVEGLQETVAGLGYLQKEISEVPYWVNPDQDWESFTFLPNDVAMIMNREPDYFLKGGPINVIKYGVWDDDGDWQGYLDAIRAGRQDSIQLDIGSIDDVVSVTRKSLLIHLEYRNDSQSMWTKAGSGTVKETRTSAFPDDETAKQEEAEATEGLSQLRAKADSMTKEEQGEETVEEQYIREYLSACTDHEIQGSGAEITFTQVCRTDWLDFRYANYLLSVR